MGCFFSKTVRCSRCNRSGSDGDLVLTDNICQKCIQIQHVREYRRRLAALRDENTIASNTVRVARVPVQIGPLIQTRQVADLSRYTVTRSAPRYTIVSMKTTRTTTRGNRLIHRPANARPLFGEYKCSKCKHYWSSRRSWRGMYQMCQKCDEHVYPHLQRELRKSDMTNTENCHPEHLCEKCMRLGYYCGNFGRNNIKRRT